MEYLYYSLRGSENILEEGLERIQAPEFREECRKTIIFWIWHGHCYHELTAAVLICTKFTHGWSHHFFIMNGGDHDV